MKRSIHTLYFILTAASLAVSCVREDYPQCDAPAGSGIVMLDIKAPGVLTRSGAEDVEATIKYLDIFVFASSDGANVHYERVNATTSGKVQLNARRSSFGAGEEYYVYLLANSSYTAELFKEKVSSRPELMSMLQEDRNIHITGAGAIGMDGAPDSFLMDGAAYSASSTEPLSPLPVVLNDGVVSHNTELKATLRRAAAKIVVKIGRGENVRFAESLPAKAGYYLRNMPYSTTLLYESSADAALWTPDAVSKEPYFNWSGEQITITSYCYGHKWADASALQSQTTMIVNIPLSCQKIMADENGNPLYDQDGKPVYEFEADGVTPVWDEEKENSYYRIPVSNAKELKRNTYYEINLTINAAGATHVMVPKPIEELKYVVLPWDEVEINVGGETSRPKYLNVNRTEMEMHNVAVDASTLSFASSSAVSATVKEAYFYNKFGNRTSVTASLLREISAVPAEGLNGGITVYSPVPENNAVRYIVLTVENEDGISREVTVAQYPLEYITNVQGWYSYRDDFYYGDDPSKVTTYELLNGQKFTLDGSNSYTTEESATRYGTRIDGGNGRYVCISWNDKNAQWGTPGNTGTGFFGSKVAEYKNDGTASILYYYWGQTEKKNRVSYTTTYYSYTYERTTTNVSGLNNARMYHVVLSSTSQQYTLGHAKLDSDGFVENTVANSKLVSPSFMIASQLGAVTRPSGINMAADHCRQYVEVAKDGTVYDDWRLPTQAEIMIIVDFQQKSDAMDVVLGGRYYYCITGNANSPTVDTQVPNGSETPAVRCIRDAY